MCWHTVECYNRYINLRKGWFRKMKKIKKINRGLILTVLVVTGVAVYLVTLNVARAGYKEEINAVLNEYIGVETSYNMLPDNYRDGKQEMTESDFNAYVAKMKTDIAEYYIDNPEAVSTTTSALEKRLKLLYDKTETVTEYEKTVKDSSFEFVGDTVTVTMNCKNKYTSNKSVASDQYSDMLGTLTDYLTGGLSTNNDDTFGDRIILQRVGDKWEITYSYLEIPGTGSDDYSAMLDKYLSGSADYAISDY